MDAGGVRETFRGNAGIMLAATLIALILLASLSAMGGRGDPVGNPYPYQNPNASPSPDAVAKIDAMTAFLWIVLMNFAVNLFFFAALFAVATLKFGDRTALSPRNRRAFLANLMIATLIITLVGAAIDMLFVAKPVSGFYSIQFNAVEWFAATFMIFCSIFIAGTMVMKLELKPGALIALAMAALNPLWWFMTDSFGEIVIVLTLIAVLFFVKFPVSSLLSWQSRASLP